MKAKMRIAKIPYVVIRVHKEQDEIIFYNEATSELDIARELAEQLLMYEEEEEINCYRTVDQVSEDGAGDFIAELRFAEVKVKN